ncbi:16S rRNA (guanine(527)-N(7))-methyltransferase RsmG [Glaciimonas sp. Gout2]|uniref:16S rRNA (guanine(527)-N(7))-methyltransferase RsmG n=1 Tax=unclassified Glaciimonas TaxID=2644401 RepID=UPI002B22A901|nr:MULTISPECIES: 16S rRNA (guanine(527)-N(7))-methyltransferase RsmG [unclassified Glaciimonas]MEB0012087.1 16S rRNA (guanine(527)-N(7))-methyltransferase RsmG [Glaciimonas sp. Cout2]MEB0084252.1 16S rRNA (guanine(527)-N(7))-methyltransferase RsmG [Glaciimonas sp. Gout2]
MSEVDTSACGALAATLRDGAKTLGIALNGLQQAQLLTYLAMLAKWNKTYNLTSIRAPDQMMTHHLLDSLAVVPAFSGAQNVLDVGAGGGLPGIILAIWAMTSQPDMRVSMIDTVHKKTAFLTQVKAEMGLKNVRVHTARVEELEVPHKFDVITSRAFAELSDFINWSAHLLADGGQFIALKGLQPAAEIERLPAGWEVAEVRRIAVPGLDAERHLITIKRAIG